MELKYSTIKQNKHKILTPIISSLFIACGGGAPANSSTPTTTPHLPRDVENTEHTLASSPDNAPLRRNGFNPHLSISSVPSVSPSLAGKLIIEGHTQYFPLATLQAVTDTQVKNRFSHQFLGIYQEPRPIVIYDDEGKHYDIGIMDTFFYQSKGLKNKTTGENRMVYINQLGTDESDKRHHGTMVAQVIARTNDRSNLYGESIAVAGWRSTSSDPKEQKVLTHVDASYYQRLIDKGVKIFNNSFGSEWPDRHIELPHLARLDKWAEEDRIFVWAAGNSALTVATVESHYPKTKPGVKNGWISVAATQDGQKLTSYSNKIGEEAKTWGITAQGDYQIPLPLEECDADANKNSNGCYHTILGTSFATPAVTATVGNVWNKYPWMDNHLVVVTVLSTANKVGSSELTDAPNAEFGWGILNNDRALLGPARLDKQLLTNRDTNDLLTVKLDYRAYQDLNKLTWGNDLVGDAGIRKQGTGILYLKGSNTYTGDTVIENGALELSRSLTNSKVKIESHGALVAKNSNSQVEIGNDNNYELSNNGGKLGVYGKGLKLKGNYKGENKAKIAIDIDTAKLEVTGALDMGNDGYIVADVGNLYLPSTTLQTKTIVEAKEIKNYDGKYAVSSNISKYIDISRFEKKDNKVEVAYKRNETKYVFEEMNQPLTVSLYHAAKNLDSALDELADVTAKPTSHTVSPQTMSVETASAVASIMSANASTLPQFVQSLSGEIYASNQNVVIKQNQLFNRTLSARIASLLNSERSGFWIDGLYAKNQVNQAGYAQIDAITKGTQLGIDTQASDAVKLGAALTVGDTRAHVDANVGSLQSKHTGVSLYGAYDWHPFYVSGRVGLTKSNSHVERMVIDKKTSASYQSKIYHLYTELGAFTDLNKLNLNPFVASEFSMISRGQFGENVAFGLQADKKHYKVNGFVAGIRGVFDLDKLRLFTSVAHAYTPNQEDFTFEANFKGTQRKIHIKGARQAQHNTFFDAGLAYQITKDFTLESSYRLSLQEGKKEGAIFSLGGVYYF